MSEQAFNNDLEALQKVAEGNMDAFRFLFDSHFTDLCNFLLIYLHRKELAEEIAIEIFTHIWEKRITLQIKTNFKSFLFASAKNKAISLYRKEHQKIVTTLEPGLTAITDVSDFRFYMENAELHRLINEAVNKLPEKSRQIYILAWEEDLSYNEIALKLGLSVKTVENHVGIALRKLREQLKPYYKQIFMICIFLLSLD